MRQYHRNIRTLREGSGIRQSELADWLGVPRLQYSELERGLRPMTVEQLLAIAERLVVTPGELLDDDAQ